jgi:dTDP-glucose 4,6-dehydratase
LYREEKVELLESARVNRRTFLYNYDSCAAVLALSDTESTLDGGVYNVATSEEIAITRLVEIIAEKLGVKNPEIIFKGNRSADPDRRLLNTDKLRSATGWDPRISLSQGLDMCIEFLKETNERL